jgi:hypothetical protein
MALLRHPPTIENDNDDEDENDGGWSRIEQGSTGYADTPIRRHADTPTRRHADTPIRRYADTPIRRYLPPYANAMMTLFQEYW